MMNREFRCIKQDLHLDASRYYNSDVYICLYIVGGFSTVVKFSIVENELLAPRSK